MRKSTTGSAQVRTSDVQLPQMGSQRGQGESASPEHCEKGTLFQLIVVREVQRLVTRSERRKEVLLQLYLQESSAGSVPVD